MPYHTDNDFMVWVSVSLRVGIGNVPLNAFTPNNIACCRWAIKIGHRDSKAFYLVFIVCKSWVPLDTTTMGPS